MVAYLIAFYADSGYSVTTDTIIAAILHDIVEDTDFTINMVELAFGTVVSEIVLGLTRVKDDKKLTVPELLESVIQKEYSILKTEKVKIKTSLSYLLIECMWPVTFYFVYLHCSNILKQSFHYTNEEIIHHNFIVAIINLVSYIILTYLSYKIYPLIITKIRIIIFLMFILFMPYLLGNVNQPFEILLIQSFFIIFRPDAFPSTSIYIKHFPILKRFTYTSWLFAISRAIMHIVTSFGLVYLIEYFGHIGLLFIIVPTSIGFIYGVRYFEKLEKEAMTDLHPIHDAGC